MQLNLGGYLKVFLALPYLRGLSPQTQASINLFHIEAASQGWEVEEGHWKGDSLIAHARNVLLAKFLQSGADELFFLDSDVACGAGVFTRMLMHRVDIVAGVYRVKSDDEKYPVRWRGDVEKRIVDVRTGLLAAEGVPFGFLRISRNMVQFLVESYPDRWFNTPLAPDLKVPALFSTECIANEFWGEDFYFCRLLRQTKHMIWVDPEIPLVHVGQKMDGAPAFYHGHLGNFLRKQGVYFKPPVICEAAPAVPETAAVAA